MDLNAPPPHARLFVILATFGILPTVADEVPPESERWQVIGSGSGVVEHLGRTAMRLGEGGAAWLTDVSFESGIVEFDVAVESERGFPGIGFRIVDMGNYEHFYLRPHQSGNPDASQYTPVFNRATGWQIYHGAGFSSPIRYRFNEWMRVRLEIAGKSARVYVDSEEPSLTVGDLRRDPQPGSLALLNTGAPAHFSGFRYEAATVTPVPNLPPTVLSDGLVRAWLVSGAMSESDARTAASGRRLDELRWSSLAVENNGIANLGRVAAATPTERTVLARLVLHADRDRTVRLRFGFSDRTTVYVNGTALFDGDDTFGSRDYRFLGTVGLHDAVYLPLRAGRNDVVFAVTEAFGGWAVVADLGEAKDLLVIESPGRDGVEQP